MTETDNAQAWGEWLRRELDKRDWRQADLVRESQGHIKRDRASKWANGNERPTYRMAIVVANTLGASHDDALTAAGYTPAAPVTPDAPPATTPTPGAAEESDADLLRRVESAMLLNELARRLDITSNPTGPENVPASLEDLEVRPPRTYALAADTLDKTEKDMPAPGEDPKDF